MSVRRSRQFTAKRSISRMWTDECSSRIAAEMKKEDPNIRAISDIIEELNEYMDKIRPADTYQQYMHVAYVYKRAEQTLTKGEIKRVYEKTVKMLGSEGDENVDAANVVLTLLYIRPIANAASYFSNATERDSAIMSFAIKSTMGILHAYVKKDRHNGNMISAQNMLMRVKERISKQMLTHDFKGGGNPTRKERSKGRGEVRVTICPPVMDVRTMVRSAEITSKELTGIVKDALEKGGADAVDSLFHIAEHPHTTKETLGKLMRCKYACVRSEVSANPHTTNAQLKRLSEDEDKLVRERADFYIQRRKTIARGRALRNVN